MAFDPNHASLQLETFIAGNCLAALLVDSILVAALPITADVIARALGAINRCQRWDTGSTSRFRRYVGLDH